MLGKNVGSEKDWFPVVLPTEKVILDLQMRILTARFIDLSDGYSFDLIRFTECLIVKACPLFCLATCHMVNQGCHFEQLDDDVIEAFDLDNFLSKWYK